jgi:hypothetical protein
MALLKRVSITGDRIRVSVPDVDVDDAALDELAFDSDAASIGLSISGELVMPTRSSGSTSTPRQTVRIIFREQENGHDFARPPIFLLGYIDPDNDHLNFPFCYMASSELSSPPIADDWPRTVITDTYAEIKQFMARDSYPGNFGRPGSGSVLGQMARARRLHSSLSSALVRWRALA